MPLGKISKGIKENVKYLFVNLAQLICWVLIAKCGCDVWDSSKNGDGVYVILFAISSCTLVHLIGRCLRRTFQKNDAVVGDYTLVVDDYSAMRRRFCDDADVVKNPRKEKP